MLSSVANFHPRELAKLVGEGTTVIPTGHLPSDFEIDVLSVRVGCTFPKDYKAFLRQCGSLISEVREDIWPRPDLGSVGPHWMQTMVELSVFGVCDEVEWLRLEVEASRFEADYGEPFVPVFAFANTSYRICFDKEGRLVDWNREDSALLDESFSEVLVRLLTEQRAYKEKLLAG